jgi:hypothetical protein
LDPPTSRSYSTNELIVGQLSCGFGVMRDKFDQFWGPLRLETYPEKAEISRDIEPHLTFPNVHRLERQGADLRSRIKKLEESNQSLTHRDKERML